MRQSRKNFPENQIKNGKTIKHFFYKDEDGQWWWVTPRQASRCHIYKCEKCFKEYPKLKGSNPKSKHYYCSKKCSNAINNIELGKKHKGSNNYRWKGGRLIHTSGYVLIYSPNHPSKNKKGYVFEHRLVIERAIGRYLTKDETIHHKNGIRHDNSPENLELRCGWHPQGTSPQDLVPWAREIIKRYGHLISE